MPFRTLFFRTLFSSLAVMAICWAIPAQAQDPLYTVSDIHVDATAASATEALNAAIAQGRPRAFQILYRRLTRQADWARQPMLDVPTLLRLSRGFTIANEKRSTTRYVADITYMFNPEAVARVLRAASIAYTQGNTKRILVIAMSPGAGHGAWAQALLSPAVRDSQVPFMVASADDASALAALNFDTASWGDVSAVAARNHSAEVALAQAVYANGKMTVNIRRLGVGETPAMASADVPMLQTVGATYPAAAQAAVHTIEDLWKTRNSIDFTQRGHLSADVRIESLAQWGDMQNRLATVGNIAGVTVTAMDMSYARIVITYLGGMDQLREALGNAGLTLTVRGPGQWTLAAAVP